MDETKNLSNIVRKFVIRPLLIGAAVYTLWDLNNKAYDTHLRETNNMSHTDSMYLEQSNRIRLLEQRALGSARDTFYMKDGTKCWDIDINGDGKKDLWIRVSNYDSLGHGTIFLRGSMKKNVYQDTINSKGCWMLNQEH